MSDKVPATLFSGFLGSGKTTIIGHVIDDLQNQGVQVAYVKNEVGSDTVDQDIVQGKHILTKELLNGCICCTLVGNFHAALTEIVETIRPDRILIEASGVSDPTAIALTLSSHPLTIRDGVVTIIDVVNYNGVPVLNSVAQRQAEFTDLIIFNKVELVSQERKQQVVGYVREVNSKAPIIEAPGGHLHPSLLFGLHPSDLAGQTKMLELAKQHLASHQPDPDSHRSPAAHPHLEEDQVQSFTIETSAIYDSHKLVTSLQALPAQLFRIKGFALVAASGTLASQADAQMMIINGVNRQVALSPVPTNFHQTQGKVVCIGYQIETLQNEVSAALATATVNSNIPSE